MRGRGSETINEQLIRLRAELEQAQNDLIEAEAELADRMAEVHAFESQIEARLGPLIDKLAALEEEIRGYKERIERVRSQRVFGPQHVPVAEQYRRTWHVPPAAAPRPPSQPLSPATEAQIKTLYRRLARRFHPDLAVDETDRVYRTEKMAAVNNAYAARSLTELMALVREAGATGIPAGRRRVDQTAAQMVEALRDELARCRRRQREIEAELSRLHLRPGVELSLDVKLAWRQGRDLLAEMTADLEQRIARRTVERDFLKPQFDQLGMQGRESA